MNICTIITEDWIETHLERWVRYIRKNTKDAKLYLFLMCGKVPNNPILGEFEKVETYDPKLFGRQWLNTVRMDACKTFGLDEVLYIDADADVLEDISGIPEIVKGNLACVRSPVMHQPWTRWLAEQGKGGVGQVEYNNGLIYMRGNFTEQYALAWEAADKYDWVPDRIKGTIAFNIMLMDTPFDTLGAEYGTIWWDADKCINAKLIQYCNSEGQKKRVMLEQVWRNAL